MATVTDLHARDDLKQHPPAEEIAAYLSEELARGERASMQGHLAECWECRQLVIGARRTLANHRSRGRRLWALPAAAALVVVALMARPSGPTPGREDPLRTDSLLSASERLPAIQIVAPAHGATVGTGPLNFVWRSQPDQPLYHVSVTDASGVQVWSAETADTSLALPVGASLQRDRTYFWTVDALGTDGRSVTTRSKRFKTAP